MCGIAGILRLDGQTPDPDRLEAMRPHLLCRGPDGSGRLVAGPCGLVHTRLAVLDPAGGHQPMTLTANPTTPSGAGTAHDEAGGGTSGEPGATGNSLPVQGGGDGGGGGPAVVFNGEIYNHRALRRELEALGHVFTTDHSDTEVLLHGYRRWGPELPARLEGMFAFALYDPADRSLFLARDRTGKKPLYLYRDAHQLTFGSLPGALLAALDGAPPLDDAALAQYLKLGYTDERSLLQGVTELPAAHWMRISPDGRTQQQRYWQPPPVAAHDPDADPLDALRTALTDAVAARLEADVPIGCFLSGGIDSSLVAALAQDRLQRDGQRLKTFSVSMPDARYDEAPIARRVAEHIGTEHRELTAEPSVEDDLHRLIAIMGQPFGDSSLLPTHWLSRAARQHVTVALSGDGGDELFAGYERYRALQLIRRHRPWLRHIPTALFPPGEQKSHRARLRRLLDAARFTHPADQYGNIVEFCSLKQIGSLGLGRLIFARSSSAAEPDFEELATSITSGRLLGPTALPDWPDIADPADAARRWDLTHYLPFDLLRKVDRASMAVALEVRCPMLSTAVCEHAARLPAATLMPRGQLKHLLKRLAADRLPAEILNRKKMGFAVPIGSWFAGELKPMLTRHLLDGPELRGLCFQRPALERMIRDHAAGRADHTHRLFALLTLAIYLRWLKHPEPPPQLSS